MKCGECGGYAEWKGPLSDLTHSECSQCGAINAHLPDNPEEDEDDT